MESGQDRLKAILAEALARTDSAARAAYLGEACAGDPSLRSKVESLVQAYERRGNALDQMFAMATPLAEGPGTAIGRYKLLEQIGEGGFGVVFMAEQVEPIRRRVALKIVKPGMDTRQVIARFEAERQALAMMDHPNIAKVFDAGATESGRPYFVMELVQGVPLTQFCDANDLSPQERLQLFMIVCEAIQHAHQKGIIHRDLKPSNILVTLHDGKPVPKVIDFGTAKALQQPLTEKTLFTGYGRLLGTPQYTSPEQAEMSGLDVDIRADVYSLGVLLYELLTGTTPFEAERLRTAAFEEMVRMIRHEEPPKPSTRVSTLGARATEIAKHRQVDPALLSRTLRGDLDWVVMKALEKDRTRRYKDARSLADDLLRHLRHQPVAAGPPSVLYRARKFARRRRGALVTGGAVAVVICGAVLLSYWQSVRTGEAEERADSSRAQLKSALSQPGVASRSTDTRARGLFNGMAHVERAAELSPDERYLAYADWSEGDAGVMVRELESGNLRKFTRSPKDVLGLYGKTEDLVEGAVQRATGTPRTGAGMQFYGHTWSPDSRWLTYLWMTPPRLEVELRIASPETRESRLLLPPTIGAYYEPMDWSPDGEWLVCCGHKPGALALVSVPEGRVRVLGEFPSEPPEHARFSPDGKQVVFSQLVGGPEPGERRHALFVTEVASGGTRPLNLPGNCRTPIWSPNQPVILFTSERLSSWDLWGVRVAEDEAPSEPFPVQYGFPYHKLRLTRAGKLIVHRDVKPGDGYTIAVAREPSERLKVESLPGRIYFSMDGRLHVMSVTNGKACVTPFPSLSHPSRSLHGGHRWFLEIRALPSTGTNELRRELFVMRDDAEAGQGLQLTDLPGLGQMTHVNGFSIRPIQTGREPDRVIGWARDASRGLDDGLISWAATKAKNSPTGSSPPSEIYVARVGFGPDGNITGLAEPLSVEPLVVGASTHDWSPDGRRLVYTRPGRTNLLQILDMQTRGASLLAEGRAPAWSPDGNWIAFLRGHASLHVIRPDGSGLRALGRMDPPPGVVFGFPWPGFYRVVWAPDSRALVYEFREDIGPYKTYHQLFYQALDGGQPQCLTRNLQADASPIAWLEGEK
jgi:serine/threonine protein kinase